MFYGLNLDECIEELFHEMERIQDGNSGHSIAIEANSVEEAAQELSNRLVDFFEIKMYESDIFGKELIDEEEEDFD